MVKVFFLVSPRSCCVPGWVRADSQERPPGWLTCMDVVTPRRGSIRSGSSSFGVTAAFKWSHLTSLWSLSSATVAHRRRLSSTAAAAAEVGDLSAPYRSTDRPGPGAGSNKTLSYRGLLCENCFCVRQHNTKQFIFSFSPPPFGNIDDWHWRRKGRRRHLLDTIFIIIFLPLWPLNSLRRRRRRTKMANLQGENGQTSRRTTRSCI